MPVMFNNGSVLFVGGSIAMHADCCCGGASCSACGGTCADEPSLSVDVSGLTACGTCTEADTQYCVRFRFWANPNSCPDPTGDPFIDTNTCMTWSTIEGYGGFDSCFMGVNGPIVITYISGPYDTYGTGTECAPCQDVLSETVSLSQDASCPNAAWSGTGRTERYPVDVTITWNSTESCYVLEVYCRASDGDFDILVWRGCKGGTNPAGAYTSDETGCDISVSSLVVS